MKFAYLIMAHDNPWQLNKLLEALDMIDNDIYLHIDNKNRDINVSALKNIITKARLFVYKKYNVKWGGLSQTKCQMFLLEKAICCEHDYYHLLSGHDMPIKPDSEIRDFFSKNKGKEFIHFESDGCCQKEYCRYYYLGENLFSRLVIRFQKRIDINRNLYCGANWFSITHRFALEFVKRKKKMINMVAFSKHSDEYILQTFFKRVAKGNYLLYLQTDDPFDYAPVARLIDWKRGTPYVWRNEDYIEIMSSNRMFARKLDMNIDIKIIDRIFDSLYEK